MLSCYNRGCGKDFDPANNPDGKILPPKKNKNTQFESIKSSVCRKWMCKHELISVASSVISLWLGNIEKN